MSKKKSTESCYVILTIGFGCNGSKRSIWKLNLFKKEQERNNKKSVNKLKI